MRWRGLSAWVCGLPAWLGCSAGVGVGVLLGGHAPVDPCLPASSMHAAVPFPSFHQGQVQGGTRAGQSRRMTYATPPGTVVRRAPRCGAVRCGASPPSGIGTHGGRRHTSRVPAGYPAKNNRPSSSSLVIRGTYGGAAGLPCSQGYIAGEGMERIRNSTPWQDREDAPELGFAAAAADVSQQTGASS